MQFTKAEQLNILVCPQCKGVGYNGINKCSRCRGMEMGIISHGKFLFWDYPLTRYNLSLQKARRVLNKIRFITVLALVLTFWLFFGLQIYNSGLYLLLVNVKTFVDFFTTLKPNVAILFWFGALTVLYLWYRTIVQKQVYGKVEHYEFNFEKHNNPLADVNINDWQAVKKIKRGLRHNISDAFTAEALGALGDAYRLADKNNSTEATALHIFYTLLSYNRVANIFVRLGLPAETMRNFIKPLLSQDNKKTSAGVAPNVAGDFRQTIFSAYLKAYNVRQDYVSVTELLESCVAQLPNIQNALFDLNIDQRKLNNVIEWARIREHLYRQYMRLRQAAKHHSKHGMDRAMTAVATPYLNRFSDDLTLLAHYGNLENCVARNKEIDEIYRVIDGGQHSVLLVGDNGVGKKSIVEGIAQNMIEDEVPKRLHDKRLVRISVSALLAGTDPAGAVERLRNIMHEIIRARNVVLFIHNIHELMGVSAGGNEGSLDVADTLAEFLSQGQFLTIATTTNEEYARHFANSTLGGSFTKVDIGEMNQDQAIQVLEAKVGQTEYKHNVFFSYDAIEKSVELSAKFMHDLTLPGSALEVLTESAVLTHNKKGANSLVTGEEAAMVVSEKTKIPVTTVSSDESSKLLKLEEEMHKRVIGQDEAVDLVANALRRSRAEIRSTAKPIANFLFLGPTGVGKTELAKTIAQVYFGGEKLMIRLDMSEYQDKSGIYRLIGAPGEKGSGILTEAVRRHPFSLILMDEIEKADPDILNLFLQVMDDGRLTDSSGRTVDFTNTIIIATSNAATAYVQEQMRAGLSSEAIKERLLHGQLNQYFRPEFLNRFDGIVLFKALSKEDIKQVAALMLKRIGKDLETKGIQLEIEDAALDFLAEVGFDPEFGARPMRRALQERVENKLAEFFLSQKLHCGSTAIIGDKGSIRIVG